MREKARHHPKPTDLVLQAVGRTPNGKKIAADQAGVAVTDRGFIPVDIQMRTNVPHIFAIGDIVGQPMVGPQGGARGPCGGRGGRWRAAGRQGLGQCRLQRPRDSQRGLHRPRDRLGVGLTEEQAKAQGIKVKKGLFPWSASGRAIANGRDEGFTKLLFDDSPESHGHGKILGGAASSAPTRAT